MVANDLGDRLIRMSESGLTTISLLPIRSQQVLLSDFNRDGYQDIISWTGKDLKIVLGHKLGFEEQVSITQDCQHQVLGLQADREGDVIISTTHMPYVFKKDVGLVPLCAWPDIKALAPMRPIQYIDLDNDGTNEIVQSGARGYVVADHKNGHWKSSAHAGLRSGFGTATSARVDLDHDGKLDLAMAGSDGLGLWRTVTGRMYNQHPSGETDYVPSTGQRDILINDFNGDGLQDLIILYERAIPHCFFNRGFATYGFAAELDLAAGKNALRTAAQGQQAGLLTDMNGDGAPDLVMVLSDGSIYACMREKRKQELTLCIDAPSNITTPIELMIESEQRSLGVWSLESGRPLYIGLEKPGPLHLSWKSKGADKQQQKVLLVDGPVRIQLGLAAVEAADAGW